MSLLSVTVKRAKFIGDQAAQFNTYVTLKLQNVKTTTQTVKGAEPVWDQDFLFETNTVHAGLLVEVWTKGMIIDRALGFQFITLDSLPYNQYNYPAAYEQWYNIDADVVMVNGEVGGTRDPTGHMLLLDLHFEMPFDVDTQGDSINNRMGYNNTLDYTSTQHNNEQYIENCYSDYQSDFNYSVNTQQANHQNQNGPIVRGNYGNLTTPQSSLETSRQNSYERDERQYFDVNNFYNNQQNYNQDFSPNYDANGEMIDGDFDNDALYYNSRPMNSASSYNRGSTHRTVRQLSKKNLERQNTLYEDEYEPLDTCSELNYNMNYNNDDYYDGYGYANNQQMQNGDYVYDQSYATKKSLPQPPMSCSQSVNDGFSHRGASLPATPVSHQRQNRQLPKHTSPTHQQSRGLPKLTRQLPSSIESAASTFSSLFGMGRSAVAASRRNVPIVNEPEPENDISLYKATMMPSDITQQTQMQDNSYGDYSNYNENYNYAYHSQDSADELMIDEKYDGDNNNLVNGRLGAALLPSAPSYERSSSLDYSHYSYHTTNSEPLASMKDIPSIDVQSSGYEDYYGDEYYDAQMYPTPTKAATMNSIDSIITPSPKKSKRLPSTAPSISYQSITQHQTHPVSTTPSLMTAAGAGLSSLFSSISHSLHSPATTISSLMSPSVPVATTSSLFHNSSFSSAYGTNFSTPSTGYMPSTSLYNPMISTSLYNPMTSSSLYKAVTSYDSTYGIGTSSYSIGTNSYSIGTHSYSIGTTSYNIGTTSSYNIGTSSYSVGTTTTSSIYTPSSLYNVSSSIYTPTTTSYLPTTMSIYGTASSIYQPTTSMGLILGHSPIPEEDGEMLLEETCETTFPSYTCAVSNGFTSYTISVSDPYALTTATSSLYTPITTSSLLSNITTSSYKSPDILTTPFYTSSIYDLEPKIEEEYREDFEDDVLPITSASNIVSGNDYSTSNSLYKPAAVTSYSSTGTTSGDYYLHQNSTYLMPAKLSTIPETANDIYQSSTDLTATVEPYDELTTPGAYDYTENENDYIASGDLKNTNIYQINYTTQQPLTYPAQTGSITTSSTMLPTGSQPEQKKSLFGSFFSDGLNVIGSSVNTIKSTATNLAATAVGAATAAASQTQSSNSAATTSSTMGTTNKPVISQSSVKLQKQTSEIYDEINEYFDYEPKHDQYEYEPDYFNEEEENRYLAEHQHQSPENNNYMSPTYEPHASSHAANDYVNRSNDNNNDTYAYSDNKTTQLNNNSSKMDRNDTNNNANKLYDYQHTSYDDHMDDKTKLGLNNNQNHHDDDYYAETYEDEKQHHHEDITNISTDDRRYEDEFDNQYSQDSTALKKQMLHNKQMSILDEDSHTDDYDADHSNGKNHKMLSEQKTIDDEYLDDFDEDGNINHRKASDFNGFMKKQESIMEDDPELKHLEEQQNLKNQQQLLQQDFDPNKDIDHFVDPEIKQKKSVTICEDEIIVHEKPREKRTAKQRWHWAYNRIVHQQQVSANFS